MLRTSNVEALELGNLDPRVNEQFADGIESIVQLFHDESAKFGVGSRKASITVVVEFDHNLETRGTAMTVAVSSKLPKYRKVSATLQAPRGGTRFLIELDDAADQVDLFLNNDSDSKEH